MKQQIASKTAGFGALALALLAAGCSGNGAPVNPAAAGPAGLQTAQGAMSEIASPDHQRKHRPPCTATTNAANFNGTAIAKGDWLWFSSVTMLPGNNSAAKIDMRDSKITFTAGSTNYTIKSPAMRLRLAGSNVALVYKKRGHHHNGGQGHYQLKAPVNTAGNDLLNAVAWQVPADLPGGIQNVTWSAKFFTKSNVQNMHWQWAAAVYTQFSDKFKDIQIKPVDDNNYPPYNSDHAGTPEAFKQYVIGGATGGGGANYTGGYSGTVSITPCQ